VNQQRWATSFPPEREVTREQFVELLKPEMDMSAKFFGSRILCQQLDTMPAKDPTRNVPVISDTHLGAMKAEITRIWESTSDVVQAYWDPVKELGLRLTEDLEKDWYV